MYSALTVAKYVIKRCNDTDRTISNLKLQKLLYFVQAEFLVSTGLPCFKEEIEAWDFGPVVPVVYHKYKVYGSASIPFLSERLSTPFTENDKKLINGIVDECAQYSASTLVEITHHQSPWIDAYKPYSNNVITKRSIKEYFSED